MNRALQTGCALLLAIIPALAKAQLDSPQIGWEATLSTDLHDVSGTVAILDEDTVQVSDFTFDGLGLSIYFYLAKEETPAAFSAGLSIGPQLLGMAFDGSQSPILIDLPEGSTLEGQHAISVWCDAVGVSFGSGTFAPVADASADFDGDSDVDGADLLLWQRGVGIASGMALPIDGDANGDGQVDRADLITWEQQFGGDAAVLGASVPEPGCLAMCSVVAAMFSGLRRMRRQVL